MGTNRTIAMTSTAVRVSREDRPYDVVVYGCTGNAGRGTALHVIQATPAEMRSRIAMAGRNKQKVEQLLTSVYQELGIPLSQPDGHYPGIIVADSSDAASMVRMTRATRVLISCAGPYGRFGEAAVVACIDSKTHYLDITGEVGWVNRMANEYGAAAEQSGVALLPFSGYDCIPAELCMALGMDELGKSGASGIAGLNLVNRTVGGGGLPKGTIETVLDEIEGKAVKAVAGDTDFFPAEFNSKVEATLSHLGYVFPYWSSHMKEATAPNFMAQVNVPVLSRSAAAFGLDPFDITDRSSVVEQPSAATLWGLIPNLVYMCLLACVGLLATIPQFRYWLRGRLQTYSYNGNPNSKVIFDAEAIAKDGGVTSRVHLQCPGDPGIYATGLFATGVALTLSKATDPDSTYLPPRAGFNSPVVALNNNKGLLLEQLTQCGVKVSVD